MNPHRKIRSSPALNAGLSKPVQGGLSVAALVLIPLLAIGGGDGFRDFLDFGTGVLSLVSLTASVAWGLIATDRLLLTTRQRLLAQGIHRATAVASLGFLLLHGTVKVSLGHVELIGALVPFGLGLTGTAGLIGFGSLAGLLMVVAASTGALRSALAGRGSVAARWRPLHMLAYPAWCAALVHGLYAGRPAAGWVVVLYCLALAGAAAAVAVRLLPAPVQRRLAERFLALVAPDTQAGPGAAGRERSRRDPAVAPLPGAADLPAPPAYDPELRREPAMRPDPPDLAFDRPLGARPRSLTVPATPSMPAPAPMPMPAPASVQEPSPLTAEPTAAPAPGPGPTAAPGRQPVVGAGISAGYRAVSLGNAAAPTQEIPFAERVPMTEELPIVTEEPNSRPGYWPTPSPPPPAQSPAPPSYDTTEPAPGPFHRPPAGEPWTAPAGDRP
ncbi:hypothetical protein [Streptomyces sp. NPDC047928]|uniref:hypothetical protein n=1 Tax=unclassified Streptomyces TaxID=2593676 RepID=UPI003714AD8D